jgi:superfamily II DNA or RNA helicase
LNKVAYFSEHYADVRLPIADGQDLGLRRAQLGAIHGLASHFTIRPEPAIVSMPTGTGKTAVLMTTAFLQRSRRALVVTPSQLVRNQIAQEFEELELLKRIKVLDTAVPSPNVLEVKQRCTDVGDWQAFHEADIVVATPNTISPGFEDIVPPPPDLFDLILVDEAHHSPARTWKALLDAFPSAKRALFTATPYRQDGLEIRGRFAYSYPLRAAYEDGVFGKVRFIPVRPSANESTDVAIALTAEKVLREDRQNGHEHYLMVRTDRKTRADELLKVYSENTQLKLWIVHSGHSFSRVRQAVERMKAGTLDGIVCVDMFGEGFDFPQLKIAAIHSPHRSLSVTLQFIGRFTRVGGANLGEAKFIAAPTDIQGETTRLYDEEAVWQDIIIDLSEGRITKEERIREVLSHIEPPTETTFATEGLSLYSLHPYCHVKIYQTAGHVDVTAPLKLPEPFEVVYRQPDAALSTCILITNETEQPKWTNSMDFARSEFDLMIVYYDEPSKLLFINSSRTKSFTLYEEIASQLSAGSHEILSLPLVNHVLAGVENPEFFNIGMKNRLHTSTRESYRIIAGSSAQKAVGKTEGRLYHRGHVFGQGTEAGQLVTIGYSSASKVWRNTRFQIPELLDWCKQLARKIVNREQVRTGSGLDHLTVGVEVDAIPEEVLAVDWDARVYQRPYTLHVNGQPPLDLVNATLNIDRANTTGTCVRVIVEARTDQWAAEFSLDARPFFRPVGTWEDDVRVVCGSESQRLIDYLNSELPHFYLRDCSELRGRHHVPWDDEFEPLEQERLQPRDWTGARVDITREFYKHERAEGEPTSIHEFLKEELMATEAAAIFYDHGTGEIADYIAVHGEEQDLVVTLFHCKGTKKNRDGTAPNPGSRVEDVYEVCGQAVKCIRWLGREDKLLDNMRRRERDVGSHFLRGDAKQLDKLFREHGRKPLYRVALVQPGLSKAEINQGCARVIAAANEYLLREISSDLIVLCSP